MDKVARLAKLREKISEMFEGDDKADPVVVERVNQIANDAVASMPEAPPKEEPVQDPKDVMLERLKERVEAIKASTDVSDELKAKLDQVASAVEAVLAEEEAPASAEAPNPFEQSPAA